jgi:tartrate dehydratase beta subunit/fumarate hydratase class I family protein
MTKAVGVAFVCTVQTATEMMESNLKAIRMVSYNSGMLAAMWQSGYSARKVI